MKTAENNKVWTIGHSTHSFNDFLEMLHSFNIEQVIDVRRFPGSRKFPHFNKQNFETSLPENKIDYIHLENLGGRRKSNPNSRNTIWRHPSFRGYADYMETENFKKGLQELKELTKETPSAIMCSEAVWWSCHRSMIADALKADGWVVMHIMGSKNGIVHPYTQPAKIKDGDLSYGG